MAKVKVSPKMLVNPTANEVAAILGTGSPGIAAGPVKAVVVSPVAVPAPAAPIDLDALMADFGGTGVPVASSESSSHPTFKIGNTAAIGQYISALKDKKDAEARLDDAFSQIEPEVEKQREEFCQRVGRYERTVLVDSVLQYTVQNRYCGIDPKHYAAIKATFGAEYDKYFAQTYEIKLDEETFDNMTPDKKAMLIKGMAELCKTVGVNPFKTKPVVRPKEAFTTDRILNPLVMAKYKSLKEDGKVKAFKATLQEPKKK